MARVQLFLPTVSAEFFSDRERLRHRLTRPDLEERVQEDFIQTGDDTLETQHRTFQGCDGAWLALHHGKRLFIAKAAPDARWW